MLRGIYSSAAGMTTQYKKIDVIGNNISNVNTTGYKQDNVTLTTFGKELASRTSDSKEVGTLPLCVYLGKESTDLSNGTLAYTGLNSDIALAGDGYFAVRTAAGETKYTRSGEFSVDNQGFLALTGGERLLSAGGGELRVGSENFNIALDGTVTTQNGTIGKVAVFNTAANGVSKRRDGFFDLQGATEANTEIRQGWLENSNTDIIENMTQMMDSQRAFQGNQQAMQVSLQTLDKLVTEVGTK